MLGWKSFSYLFPVDERFLPDSLIEFLSRFLPVYNRALFPRGFSFCEGDVDFSFETDGPGAARRFLRAGNESTLQLGYCGYNSTPPLCNLTLTAQLLSRREAGKDFSSEAHFLFRSFRFRFPSGVIRLEAEKIQNSLGRPSLKRFV